MGNFKIVISGIGGHGVQRHKEEGETINFDVDGDWTVDSIAKQIAIIAKKMFAERSVAAFDAELIHWPGEEGEVRDNLITGIRTGSFNPKPKVDESEVPLTEAEIIETVQTFTHTRDAILKEESFNLTLGEQANVMNAVFLETPITAVPDGNAEPDEPLEINRELIDQQIAEGDAEAPGPGI